MVGRFFFGLHCRISRAGIQSHCCELEGTVLNNRSMAVCPPPGPVHVASGNCYSSADDINTSVTVRTRSLADSADTLLVAQ